MFAPRSAENNGQELDHRVRTTLGHNRGQRKCPDTGQKVYNYGQQFLDTWAQARAGLSTSPGESCSAVLRRGHQVSR